MFAKEGDTAMIWDETRWDSKVREKWGKPSAEEAIAGNVQDYLEHLNQRRDDDYRDRYEDVAA